MGNLVQVINQTKRPFLKIAPCSPTPAARGPSTEQFLNYFNSSWVTSRNRERLRNLQFLCSIRIFVTMSTLPYPCVDLSGERHCRQKARVFVSLG